MRKIKEKTALPIIASNAVIFNINKARNLYINKMLEPWDKSMDWIMERCFPEEVLTYCKRGYQYTTDNVQHYNSFSIRILSDAIILGDRSYLDKSKMLPPREDYQITAETVIPELVERCKKVREILYDYAKAAHVFNWFNSCGSSAVAMRNYLPWIQSVIPYQYVSLIEGSKFQEPNGLASILGLVKEVAGIMNRALLIQNETNHPKQGITLYFKHTEINGIVVPEYKMEC